MDPKALARQFKSDPGAAIISLIKEADGVSTLGSIRALLMAAGATKKDVDTRWKPVQSLLAEHPHIRRSGKYGYQWSTEPINADDALQSLAKDRKLPGWLRMALVETVATALPPGGEMLGGQRRAVDDAKVFVDIAGSVEELLYRGKGGDEILDWTRRQGRERSIEFIGKAGQTVSFDTREHVAETGSPHRDSKVVVVRPGAVWQGGGSPILISRALVRQEH